jgi:dTDP-4-amino-4,6-dideoxygalactose transaminase
MLRSVAALTRLPSSLPSLGRPDNLPPASLAAAAEALTSARLHRYQHDDPAASRVAQLEVAFAALARRRYCCAVNSCGSAMFLALRALEVPQGAPVLVNAHTLTPVPSAIVHAGARPVLVEADAMGLADLGDLETKMKSSGAAFLLLSHMRGRVCDMDEVVRLCGEHGVLLIEDCAHALGSTWAGRPCGEFGAVAVFSCQTNKLINGGEGGLLVTDMEEVAARTILMSGSYGHWVTFHPLLPPRELMYSLHDSTPNYSMRMSELTAAVVTPQLAMLDAKVAKLNRVYRCAQASEAIERSEGAGGSGGLPRQPHCDPLPP